MNVGASAPEEAGQYFSWGNTDGHTPGDGYEFTQASYNNTPGVEISGNIPLSQDAARVNMGGSWRIPSQDECAELIDNCDFLWTIQNSVYGGLFTSKINGASIFIPAAGYIDDSSLEDINDNGFYWSSTYFEGESANYLGFEIGGVAADDYNDRYLGFSIRAVM